ncbi:MAG: DegT/DnrJ/EryC1/StrS family aminotransferase [Dysgonamonadaceae bacterium]|jgi:dTDP-4-amino-4,6-dideoxygalactose transaminase|nr:DegT/DnrJ/EryC1/StrS family aminotransferase [Dysgonamonadaceae bacterium]
MKKIEMIDLSAHYCGIKQKIDRAVLDVIQSGKYINGKQVEDFSINLAKYTAAKHIIPCANGTDALKLALLALNLKEGDEVIIPDFTFIAAAEMIALLRLTPVVVDVDPHTFNIDVNKIAGAITGKTRAIIPVHLFGQCCDMAPIMEIAHEKNLYIIEDNAQSIGAVYTFPDGRKQQAGTMGDIGTFSFFPTKNLGCYGDGGALATNNESLSQKLKMLTMHGQAKKYEHRIIGCNSRLDNIQAAILNVKLPHLDADIASRQLAAKTYSRQLAGKTTQIETPAIQSYSGHVFNQYTIKINSEKRDSLRKHLLENNIPTMIYYPTSVHSQEAFRKITKLGSDLSESEKLCRSVLSLPMHPNLSGEQINYIVEKLLEKL